MNNDPTDGWKGGWSHRMKTGYTTKMEARNKATLPGANTWLEMNYKKINYKNSAKIHIFTFCAQKIQNRKLIALLVNHWNEIKLSEGVKCHSLNRRRPKTQGVLKTSSTERFSPRSAQHFHSELSARDFGLLRLNLFVHFPSIWQHFDSELLWLPCKAWICTEFSWLRNQTKKEEIRELPVSSSCNAKKLKRLQTAFKLLTLKNRLNFENNSWMNGLTNVFLSLLFQSVKRHNNKNMSLHVGCS